MAFRGWVKRTIILAITIVIAASLLLAAWPSPPASALITKSDWQVSGNAYQNVLPSRFEIDNDIKASAQSVYWRTWHPETGATVATITTSPFKASTYMAIPYGGFAGAPGIQLDLRCVLSGKTIPVATARSNTQMTEAKIRVPHGWCNGDAVLSADTHSTSKYIEVGTPFRISWIEYYKNSFLGLVGLFGVVFAFAWGMVFLPTAVALWLGKRRSLVISGIACLGLIGYAMFFLFFFSSTAGKAVSACLFLFEASLISWLYVRRRRDLVYALEQWKTPTTLWVTVSFVAFLLAVATYNGAGPWTVNALFKPVQWSSDNQLPMQIAEYLFHGLDPRTLPYGAWKISDRPPLSYGLMATLRLLPWAIANHRDGDALYYQYELISGIIINGLWIVALHQLLTRLRLEARKLNLILLVIGMTGFAIFNSAYIWPKMLGAAFGLIAFMFLLDPQHYLTSGKFQKYGTPLLAAALFSGLALMSHGGTAFGVIAAIIVATWYRGLPSPWLAIRALLTGLAVLVPWWLWQHFEQPPGTALVKFAFTGNYGFGHETQSVLSAIYDAYSKLTLSSWLDLKLHGLRVLFTGSGSTCGAQEIAPVSSLYGSLRANDFFYLGPSLRFLAIGFLPLLLKRWTPEGGRADWRLHYARVLVGTGSLGVGLYALAAFHCYVNHALSYQAILEILAGLVLVLRGANRWYFNLCLKLSILYGAIVWIIDPLASATYVHIAPVACLCVIAIFVYYYFYARSQRDGVNVDRSH